jgi:regulatory protein
VSSVVKITTITPRGRRGKLTLRQRRKRNQEIEEQLPLDPAKARERVLQRAAKLLAAKQRSVEELREKLSTTRGATKAMVDEAIARLREYGYLDDAKFAQSYASLRLRERPIGRRRLERDLWLKKVDKQTVESALDEVFECTPEQDLIDRAIAKRIRLRGKPRTREDAKKLFDHLLRRGFEFELVSEKVRATFKSESELGDDE